VSDKSLIKKRFHKSINSYNANAIVQVHMAKELIRLLCEFAGDAFSNVLELGCGTGLVTQELLKNCTIDNFTANDIVAEYEKNIRHIANHYESKVQFIEGDLEDTQLFSNSYNTILAGACLQWTTNMQTIINKLAEKLADNGVLAFSSFGKKNVAEISAITQKGLHYHTLEQHVEMCSEGFEILHASELPKALYFTSPLEVLRHLKHTGVNAVGSETWTKARLQNFEQQYSARFHTPRGYRLTYHPMYFVLRKK